MNFYHRSLDYFKIDLMSLVVMLLCYTSTLVNMYLLLIISIIYTDNDTICVFLFAVLKKYVVPKISLQSLTFIKTSINFRL